MVVKESSSLVELGQVVVLTSLAEGCRTELVVVVVVVVLEQVEAAPRLEYVLVRTWLAEHAVLGRLTRLGEGIRYWCVVGVVACAEETIVARIRRSIIRKGLEHIVIVVLGEHVLGILRLGLGLGLR